METLSATDKPSLEVEIGEFSISYEYSKCIARVNVYIKGINSPVTVEQVLLNKEDLAVIESIIMKRMIRNG